MKRFLSSLLLVSFCAVQATPMAEFSDAIAKADVAVIGSLLQQNTLTEPEALELLNEAEGVLRIFEKIYWKSWDYSAISLMFAVGSGIAHTLASRDEFFRSATGLALISLGIYSWHKWKKEDEPKGREEWTNAIAIQRLLYKASLDAKYPVKAQV